MLLLLLKNLMKNQYLKNQNEKLIKKKLDDLLVEDNNNDVPIIETKNEVEEENCYYKNKLRIYVPSGQIKIYIVK